VPADPLQDWATLAACFGMLKDSLAPQWNNLALAVPSTVIEHFSEAIAAKVPVDELIQQVPY
jgi:hypothetical protein